MESAPRLVIAGTSGGSGKTLVSLSLLLAAHASGHAVSAFKKGPDYIDAAWLRWASGRPARNLDTYLMGFDGAVASFARHASPGALNLIEGNRGLHDGVDSRGTHSTAELAKALGAPVVLVVNATKATRTAAACVLGCRALDPEVRIAGVILNQVARARHERILREAIESVCRLPVLGVVPRAPRGAPLPERHLGLVTPEDHPCIGQLRQGLLDLAKGLDLVGLLEIAASAPALPRKADTPQPGRQTGAAVKIGYLRDSAFTFYYPENLEALEAAGAQVVPVSSLAAGGLPPGLHALYIGGGFPEMHATELAANRRLLDSLRSAAERGLPIYAECGGLMLLSRAIRWQGQRHLMAGVLPFDVQVLPTPQGHGYTELSVDRPNPFFPVGLALKGHEFHYSRVLLENSVPETACAVRRGTGCFNGRDGVTTGNVWASYTHLHAIGTPEWVAGMIQAAGRFAARGAGA